MSAREERQRSPRRDEAKAGTRRRVLGAAMEVFAREGYHAARMDAIAEIAGVSKGALYFHFPGQQLSTYPPSSTDADPPRLARALVTGGARSRDRSERARPGLPIHR